MSPFYSGSLARSKSQKFKDPNQSSNHGQLSNIRADTVGTAVDEECSSIEEVTGNAVVKNMELDDDSEVLELVIMAEEEIKLDDRVLDVVTAEDEVGFVVVVGDAVVSVNVKTCVVNTTEPFGNVVVLA